MTATVTRLELRRAIRNVQACASYLGSGDRLPEEHRAWLAAYLAEHLRELQRRNEQWGEGSE